MDNQNNQNTQGPEATVSDDATDYGEEDEMTFLVIPIGDEVLDTVQVPVDRTYTEDELNRLYTNLLAESGQAPQTEQTQTATDIQPTAEQINTIMASLTDPDSEDDEDDEDSEDDEVNPETQTTPEPTQTPSETATQTPSEPPSEPPAKRLRRD